MEKTELVLDFFPNRNGNDLALVSIPLANDEYASGELFSWLTT